MYILLSHERLNLRSSLLTLGRIKASLNLLSLNRSLARIALVEPHQSFDCFHFKCNN